MGILFEYDEEKSKTNHDKHGIDFDQAKRLWNDNEAVSVTVSGINESRYLVIGKIDAKYWTAVATDRGESIRIISVRRARKKEKEIYDKQKNDFS